MERMYSMPARSRSIASTSTNMSHSNISLTVSPMRSGNSFW